MPIPADTSTVPARRPSVFISYASQDREAARALRDTLGAAGLEVWYDENELGGGDAWDQKIRRQIRECDYFVALVSGATEARKEGYFRREWRLACERTMDMADDVLFLIPVAIDDTREAGARVPDKFSTVQWLRVPGGMRTLALDGLIGRLLHGDHHASAPRGTGRAAGLPATQSFSASVPPPLIIPPVIAALPHGDHGNRKAEAAAPPPTPRFPDVPHTGGFSRWVQFLIDALKWIFTVGPVHFKRLPRVVRGAIVVALVIAILPRCSRDNESLPAGKHPVAKNHSSADETLKRVNAALALRETARKLDRSGAANDATGAASDFAKVGADIARAISAEVSPFENKTGQLVVVPFSVGVNDQALSDFAKQAFDVFYQELVSARGEVVGISLEPASSDAAAIAQGAKLKASFMVTSQFQVSAGTPTLQLRMYDVKLGVLVFTATAAAGEDAAEAAGKALAGKILAAWNRPSAPATVAP